MTQTGHSPKTNGEQLGAQRVELILQQLQSLPTLPAVAVNLLHLTGSDHSDAQQVIQVLRNDPALTAVILKLCRAADRGVTENAITLEKAVVLLGFEAIRNAVLSVQIFTQLSPHHTPGTSHTQPRAIHTDTHETPGKPATADASSDFDFSREFWRHSLATAITAEQIAQRHPARKNLNPGEAFVCGLLHDLGKLALHHILPRSYDRVIELANTSMTNIASVEHDILGLDHHDAGKRLAEHWQLPAAITASIWLHNQPPQVAQEDEHGAMVQLISLADRITRQQHWGYSGNRDFLPTVEQLAKQMELDPQVIAQVIDDIPDELAHRCEALGVDQTTSRQVLLESIAHANQTLGQLNAALHRRRKSEDQRGAMVESLEALAQLPARGGSLSATLQAVVRAAHAAYGAGPMVFWIGGHKQQSWQLWQFDTEARQQKHQLTDTLPLEEMQAEALGTAGVLPWIAGYLDPKLQTQRLDIVAMSNQPPLFIWLLHDLPGMKNPQQAGAMAGEAMVQLWGNMVHAAWQDQQYRHLAERFVHATRKINAQQAQLADQAAMVALGEMAAGAAHEMNNPMAVISGRAQLLSMRLEPNSQEYQSAQLIEQQTQKLSDLISALHLFAHPPKPRMAPADVADLLEQSIVLLRKSCPDAPAVHVRRDDRIESWTLDAQQISEAIAALLINAVEAEPISHVTIRVHVDPRNCRLILQITDDGMGMSSTVLERACDPFYSSKPAGRQTGLGLARCKRFVELHGGTLMLESREGHGTTATILLPEHTTSDLTQRPDNRTAARTVENFATHARQADGEYEGAVRSTTDTQAS